MQPKPVCSLPRKVAGNDMSTSGFLGEGNNVLNLGEPKSSVRVVDDDGELSENVVLGSGETGCKKGQTTQLLTREIRSI
jgi:hypothetical protein